MNRRALLSLLAGGAAIGMMGCSVQGESLPTYRYRLTVEVETPEGLKSGSSVIEVSTAVAGRSSIPTPGAVSHRVKGEAVTVDLGTRGLLFALLRSEGDSDWATNVVYRLSPKVPSVYDANGKFDNERDLEAQFAAMLKHREPIELPRTFPPVGHLVDQPARPLLVRFRDITDPKMVEKVDPDNLAKSFGDGVKLRRVTVQLSDEPVTSGIEKRFSWWNDYRDRHFDGTSASSEDLTTDKIMAHLSSGDFSTEFSK